MTEARNAWYVRGTRFESGLWEFSGYAGIDHEDEEVVECLPRDSTAALLWKTHPVERGIVGVELSDFARSGAPPMWFVNVHEQRSIPPATHLVAYTSDRFPPGTVISNMTFASVGAAADPQAGAVRWYPSSGVVHQVYVSEEWRRHRLGTALLYTADAFHHANGWPGALRSDGRRTDIGERFVAGLRHPHRIRPRDTVMPPMDAE